MKSRQPSQSVHSVSVNSTFVLMVSLGLAPGIFSTAVAASSNVTSVSSTVDPVDLVDLERIAEDNSDSARKVSELIAQVSEVPVIPVLPGAVYEWDRTSFAEMADPSATFQYIDTPSSPATHSDPLAPLVAPYGSAMATSPPLSATPPSLSLIASPIGIGNSSPAIVTANSKVDVELDIDFVASPSFSNSNQSMSAALAPLVAPPDSMGRPLQTVELPLDLFGTHQPQSSSSHLQAQSPPTTLETSTTASTLIPDNRPLTPPSLIFQPSLIQIGDDFSARARLQGYYYLSPNVLVGGAVDLTTGNAFSDTQSTGFSINELYIAASPSGAPNLRFVAGQLDLTSYFDRNSFAKDSLTHFINPVFQTNPALAANEIRSRPAALVNWRATDEIEVKAAAFSSAGIDSFSLDGFAGEVGISLGNFIVRGTYVSATDGGNRDSFPEIFQINRGGGNFGPLATDREIAYGVNAEWFIPEANLGFFGRYGYHENQALGLSGDTYSGGINILDLFMDNDRLGVGYGRGLSNDSLRQQQNGDELDVLEVFYDFRLAPNVRAAFDFQQRNNFSETFLGFRIRADFQLLDQSR